MIVHEWAYLGANLALTWAPKPFQKGSQEASPEQLMLKSRKPWILNTLQWFCLILGVRGGAQGHQFSLKIEVFKQHVFQECFETLFCQTWPTIGPTWAPRWLQDGGRSSTNDGFWCYVGSWGPSGPRWPQEPTKRPQETPRDPQEPSKPWFFKVLGTYFDGFSLFLFIDFLLILNIQTTYNNVIM